MLSPGNILRFVLLLALTVVLAGAAHAQQAAPGQIPALEGLINPSGDGRLSNSVIQLLLLVSVLSLVPGIAMMVTCLPFMVIVFSFMRQAIGVQQAPPNMMIMALAMFLTFFVMEPVFMQAWQTGITPYMDGNLNEQQAWTLTTEPFREFMLKRTDPEALLTLGEAVNRPVVEGQPPSFSLLATAFMLSEIKHAFQIGFVIFLPFLLIDLISASVLMAMGMIMVPPLTIALPIKVLMFVLIEGWALVAKALVGSFS